VIVITACILLVFVAIHLSVDRMRFFDVVPRSRWLSAAGGVSVAYVFVHLLPELAAGQEILKNVRFIQVGFLRHHAYLVALIGLISFYGLERLVRERAEEVRSQAPTSPAFWLHIGSFGIYNFLIGYLLLHREQPGLVSLLWYGFAMGLHFFVTDFGLFHDYRQRYPTIGRWVLTVAVSLGWVIGTLIEVSKPTVTVLTAFLAGGVILNILKEELPEERKSRFSAFVLGALGYTAVLLFT
jgi:hypothetical protein